MCRTGVEAGHVFPYDREALERLRHLTAELRLGIEPGTDYMDTIGEGGGDHDEDDDDGYDAEGEGDVEDGVFVD